MTNPIINLSALEPLYLPNEMPSLHRIRAEHEGEQAKLVKGRRPSDIVIAQNLRRYVSEWRETDYAGASDTTRELLHHWFGRDHAVKNSEDEHIPSELINSQILITPSCGTGSRSIEETIKIFQLTMRLKEAMA